MDCNTERKNVSTLCNNDMGPLMQIGFANAAFKFSTLALAMELANWQAGIDSKNIYMLPKVASVESMDTEDLYDETSYRKAKVKSGKKGFKISYDTNLDLNAKIQSFESNGGLSVFMFFESGIIQGCRTSKGTDFKPIATSFINPENYKYNSSDKVGQTVVAFEFKDQRDINDFDFLAIVIPEKGTPAWDYTQLEPLTTAVIEIVSATATKITFKVFGEHIGNTAGVKIPIQGMVKENLIKTTTAGVSQAIATMTATVGVAGQYEANGTGFTTGFLDLVAPATARADANAIKGYESLAPVAVTIA